MCDRLTGRYPKTFKFKGWHPQCMCYATPILMDEETFDDNELGDLKAALWGTEYKKKQSKDLITDVPDGFKEWVAENMDAQANWSSIPYFIRDNFVDGDLSKGLKIDLPTAAPDVPNVPQFNYDEPNDALEAYIGGDMMWINQYLRGRGDFGELSAKEKQYLEELKQVTQSDVIGECTLWRSVDARAIFGEMSDMSFSALEDYFLYGDTSKQTMQKIQRFLGIEGKEIIEKGFMSTTKDHDIAADWGDYTGSDYPILMKIRTTANTRGVDVERYTRIHNPEAEEDNPQAEMLLSCNQKFKVVSVSKDSGNICVEVELINEVQPNHVNLKTTNKEATSIPPHIEEYISHNDGKILVSPLHGNDELNSNLKLAQTLHEAMGEKVYILPNINPNGVNAHLRPEYIPKGVKDGKNADFMCANLIWDGKEASFKNTPNEWEKIKKTLENHFKKAKLQADNFIIKVPLWLSEEAITTITDNYLKVSKKNRIIIICKDNGWYKVYKNTNG